MLDQLIQLQNPLCTKLPTEAGFSDKAQMIKVAGFISDMCPAAAELTDFDSTYLFALRKRVYSTGIFNMGLFEWQTDFM